MTKKVVAPAPLATPPLAGSSWGQWFVTLRDALNSNAAQLGMVQAGTALNRPATYAAADAGRFYLATDTDALSVWDGAQWLSIMRQNAWSSYTPAISATGAMTVAGVTITTAQYRINGNSVELQLQVSMTLGGTADAFILASLPAGLPLVGNTNLMPYALSSPSYSSPTPAYARTDASVGVVMRNAAAGSNHVLGATSIFVSGSYRWI